MQKISVIIPTKNEPAIKEVIYNIKKALPKSEIVVVDNSTDNTPIMAKKMGVNVIYQSGSGFGDACIIGANKSKGDIIVFIDGDSTYDAFDILPMVELIKKNQAEYVIGNRFNKLKKDSMKNFNNFGNQLLSWISNKLYSTNISDSQSGLRAITRRGFKKLYLTTRNFDFYTQMNVEAKNKNLSIKEIPIKYYPRKGKSKLNPVSDGLVILGTTIRLLRDFNPFMVFGLTGVFFLLTGIAIAMFITFEFFLTGTVSRVPTLMISILIMLSGIFFIGMALMIDLILRELEHHK